MSSEPDEQLDQQHEWGDPMADSSSEDAASQAKLPKIISFEQLARCGDEIWIENSGQIYRLRKTRQGKLILTK